MNCLFRFLQEVIIPRGDSYTSHCSLSQSRGKQPAFEWSRNIVIVEHCLEPVDMVDWVNNVIVFLQLGRLFHSSGNERLHDCLR